jgi:hypothetical protein
MRKLIKPIFWTFLFLVMMLAIDQFFVQVPSLHPAHAVVRDFYRDFRERLIDLAFDEKKAAPKSIEAVIEKQQQKQESTTKQTDKQQTPPAKKPKAETSQRYVYSDGKGELHFTDSLDEVPDEYRGQAQPMGK